MATPERIPRIYLDIDGCVSPLPPRPTRALRWDPPGTWPAWVDPEAFNQTPMPIALLDALANLEGVEVVWATSWPLDMIEWALEKVGYSHLQLRHLNPDAASFSKLDAVRADISRDPVPFVWIDDARLPGEDFWIPPVPWRRIRPQPQFGITVIGWEAAVEWLQRAGTSTPPSDPGGRFSALWRQAIADAFAADPLLVARRVMTNIAIYTETADPPAAEVVAALDRWERVLDDEDALAKVLDAPTPDWAWETAPPFADVLSQAEHRRLVDLAYGVPPSPPVSGGYERPERPTGEPGDHAWRDDNIRMRLDITRRLRTDPDTVLTLSKMALQRLRCAEHLIDFWGPMILNGDIEGLIHCYAIDLPGAWYHGHPVTRPGKQE